MTALAVVPVQMLARAKSRLAQQLGPEAREELMGWLVERLLRELQASRRVGQVLVVTPDPAVLALAEAAGAAGLLQPGTGLNAAVELGQRYAVAGGWARVVTVLADLPLLVADHVDRMLALGREGSVVIAPDRHGLGTNLLALWPPDAIVPAFGRASRERHRRAAWEKGLSVLEFWSAGTAVDLDTPEDLDELVERWGWRPDRWLTGKGVTGWRSGTAG